MSFATKTACYFTVFKVQQSCLAREEKPDHLFHVYAPVRSGKDARRRKHPSSSVNTECLVRMQENGASIHPSN
jgi:hypothetical protein